MINMATPTPTPTPTPGIGDLLVDFSSNAILVTDNDSNRVTINGDVVADRIDFDEFVLDGVDVATRIGAISSEPGVGDSNVETHHIRDASVSTDKFALLSVAKGGTGLSNVGAGDFVFATSSGSVISSSPGLSNTPNGIAIGDQWKLKLDDGTVTAEFYEDNGSLVVNHAGSITNLNEASAGSPPTILELALSGTNLTYKLHDPDGDLRSLHLAWYSSAQSTPPTPSDVLYHTTATGSSTYSSPEGVIEVDLFEAINTGSATFSNVYNNPGLSGKVVYAVAEDGPGNLSPVSSAQ